MNRKYDRNTIHTSWKELGRIYLKCVFPPPKCHAMTIPRIKSRRRGSNAATMWIIINYQHKTCSSSHDNKPPTQRHTTDPDYSKVQLPYSSSMAHKPVQAVNVKLTNILTYTCKKTTQTTKITSLLGSNVSHSLFLGL